MLKLTVKVWADCEGLIDHFPSNQNGYELDSEEYQEDGRGTVIVLIHDHMKDVSSGVARALDTNPGVISWDVEYIED